MKIERQMIARARQKVLSAASWLTLADLAKLNGIFLHDVAAHQHACKEAKMIFSVLHEGIELFPAYSFTDDKL